MLEIVGDAVIVADPAENIVFWNAAATRIFGFTAEEALGRTLDLITPERLRHRHSLGFAESMRTGTTRYGATVLKVPASHKNGQILSIAFTVAMIFDAQQTVTGIVAVIRDETVRFIEDRELRKKLAALEALQGARQSGS